MTVAVSIIMPVYNVEKYLKKHWKAWKHKVFKIMN